MNLLNSDDVRGGGSIFGLLMVFALCFPLGWLLGTAVTPWDGFWVAAVGTLVVIWLWHLAYHRGKKWLDDHLKGYSD